MRQCSRMKAEEGRHRSGPPAELQPGRRLRQAVLLPLGLALLCVVPAASFGQTAADTPMSLELNKLEAAGKACRAYFVVDNPGETAFRSFQLDLVLFRTDGVIDRRLALSLAPISPRKKTVKIFEIGELPCEAIGSVLLNDISDCSSASGAVPDCADKLRVSSRTAVPFSK